MIHSVSSPFKPTRRAPHGLWALLVGVLGVGVGCTVSNAVNDDPEGNAAANTYRGGPSERSISLWSAPGENLLTALTEVEVNDKDTVLPIDNRVLGSLLGEAGAYFSATTTYTPFVGTLEPQTMVCDDRVLPDAVEGLCAALAAPRAADEDSEGGPTRLVLINELQHVAYQRTALRKLLGCAWDAGFRYLGIESLEEDDAAVEARGYLSRTASGEFAREPQLARLVDEGIELGYDIVSFEVANRCADCRHIDGIKMHAAEQAANLVAKTFAVDPDAKVLVLTSAMQSFKRLWGGAEPYTTSLGAHLWEQAGIEPYSVEQVAIDRPTLQFGASAPNPPSGMYVISGAENGSCLGSYGPGSPTGRGTLDAAIVHIPPRVDAQRWDWLHSPAEERRSVTATCASCAPGERLLVQAFPTGIDRTDRVPIDQALCGAGEACQLGLPPARYDVVVWSESALVGVSEVDLEASAAVTVAP